MTAADRQREANRASQRRRRESRRRNHLCLNCGATPKPGRLSCQACADQYATYRPASTTYEHRGGPEDDRLSEGDRELLAAGRCERCHLLLPCHDCLPTSAAAYAGSRRGEQDVTVTKGRR